MIDRERWVKVADEIAEYVLDMQNAPIGGPMEEVIADMIIAELKIQMRDEHDRI